MDSVRNDPELATEVITLLGKELKSARERIRALEGQILHGDSIVIDELRERAEAAETSAIHFKIELENLRSSLRVKEEVTEEKCSIPPPEERVVEPKLDLTDKVKELEEALQVYYGKYKTQKEAKKTLRESISELEIRVNELTHENQRLRQVAEGSLSQQPPQAMPMKQPPLPGRREFSAFMDKFPQCERPHYSRLHPVCHRGVDITAYLDSDSTLSKFSNNFIYLPGRLRWCGSESQHGLAFGPQHVFDISKGRIFYGGVYACHNLRSWSPEGFPVPTERLSIDALVEATLENGGPAVNDERKSLEKIIKRLYSDHILKVEVMGLQCIGFNSELYEALDRRFRASLPVLGKREGSHLESGQSAKKKRTTTS